MSTFEMYAKGAKGQGSAGKSVFSTTLHNRVVIYKLSMLMLQYMIITEESWIQFDYRFTTNKYTGAHSNNKKKR